MRLTQKNLLDIEHPMHRYQYHNVTFNHFLDMHLVLNGIIELTALNWAKNIILNFNTKMNFNVHRKITKKYCKTSTLL